MNIIKKIRGDNFITFKESNHSYTGNDDCTYESVSRVIHSIVPHFDSEKISMAMARGSKKKQKEILQEWEFKKNRSIKHGNYIHDNMEEFFLTGYCKESKLRVLCRDLLRNVFIHASAILPEFIFYSKKYKVAGTADLPYIVPTRNKDNTFVLNIFDWKTNLEKGINYESFKDYPDGSRKYFGDYLLWPVSHMPNCEYSKYSLQMSIYAYMAEETYGIKIGRLALVYINKEHKENIIPANYLRNEAIAILEHYKNN